MNKRFEDLMYHAGLTAQGCWDELGTYEQEAIGKFAELIILECANRVNGMVVMDKGHIPQDPHSQGWNRAVAYAGKELKKHFGVEE